MMQQGDVLLAQTTNDGDIESVDGVTTMTCGFETAVYLSMFSGAGWWGDLQETDPAMQYPSETGALLESAPAVPANLRRIEQAALRDLAWLIDQEIASRVEVSATMPGVDRIELQIIIEAEGERSRFNFVENWACFRETGAQDVPGGVISSGHTNRANWQLIAPPYPESGLADISINPVTGELWALNRSAGRIWLLVGGLGGTWQDRTGNWPGGSQGTIDTHSVDGSVWASRQTGFPNRIYASDDTGVTWVQQGTPTWTQSILFMAIDGSNNDVWVVANDLVVYRRAGNLGAYVAVASYPGIAPSGMDINEATGVVYIVDGNANEVWSLDGTTFTQDTAYPGIAPDRITVDSSNGDLWVADASGVTYLQTAGQGPWALTGTMLAVGNTDITVNIVNGDLYRTEAGVELIYFSPGVPA